MPIEPRPDWRKVAEAHNIRISDKQCERLTALSRTLLGLRGLIDWTEEPVQSFDMPELPQEGESAGEINS